MLYNYYNLNKQMNPGNIMTDVYLSHAIQNAQNITEVVEMINNGGHSEGIEGVEFTPEMLAGIYSYVAVEDSDSECRVHINDNHDAHLDVLIDCGAQFSSADALLYASQLTLAA